MKPTNLLAPCFAAFLLAVPLAWAQEHPTVTAQANTVYVGADGKFEAAPAEEDAPADPTAEDPAAEAPAAEDPACVCPV